MNQTLDTAITPLVNSAALATYKKLPKKTQYITLLIAGVAVSAYAIYRLIKGTQPTLSNYQSTGYE